MNSQIQSSGSPSPKSSLEILCQNMLDGLHAAAQPLSILRPGLGNPYLERLTMEELRELVASSAIEVERLCSVFNYLQLLVCAEFIKPQLTETSLVPILAHAAEGVSLLFKEAGMSFEPALADDCPLVLVDRGRVLEAVSSVLLIAHSISRCDDTIDLFTSLDSPDTVRVTVRNRAAHVDALDAEKRLGMMLAEANTRSQRGTMAWTLQPFTVEFELPRVPKPGY